MLSVTIYPISIYYLPPDHIERYLFIQHEDLPLLLADPYTAAAKIAMVPVAKSDVSNLRDWHRVIVTPVVQVILEAC